MKARRVNSGWETEIWEAARVDSQFTPSLPSQIITICEFYQRVNVLFFFLFTAGYGNV